MQKQRTSTRRAQPDQATVRNVRRFALHSAENRSIVQHFYQTLNTPVSLSCYLLYKYEEYDQLVCKDVNPRNYEDALSFRNDFAAVSYLRKNGSVKTSFDTKAAAIDAFKGAEQQCRRTNLSLKDYLSGRHTAGLSENSLNVTIRKIDRILGEISIDELLDECGWGPGVSLTVKGENTSASQKFDCDRDITADLYDLLGPICSLAYPHWGAWSQPVYQVGNTIITVPKNAKIDRTIAIEPGLNSWVQKGIGRMIRKRLRRAGYNLDSDFKNQRGAYLGSLTGNLATVDFSAASDSISIEAVRLLLPPKWFSLLDAARSQNYTLSGVTTRFHKFSSMGNGFTFELESLIFVVCALACCEVASEDVTHVSVFGDDIILPSNVVASYTSLVTFLGFRVNDHKSYSDGYFRESCGCYYFRGMNVKPIFNRSDIKLLKDLYRLSNAVRRLSHDRNESYGCDIQLRAHWSFIVHRIPEALRFFGPVSGGDSVIHENMDRCISRRPKGQLEGFLFSGLPQVALSVAVDSHGILLHRLSSRSRDRCFGNDVPLRARTRMVFKKNMFVSQWYELGPWY